MNWTDTLKAEVEDAYKATFGLLEQVDGDKLDWKPPVGDNWMTADQLLKHIETACGACFKGFLTGDWGMPEGMDPSDMKPEDMLPPASSMPAAGSVAETKKALEQDKQVALGVIAEAGEERLDNEDTTAPWDPTPMKLGRRLLQMVGHLNTHRTQLFYYLKMQGKPVNTFHLYG